MKNLLLILLFFVFGIYHVIAQPGYGLEGLPKDNSHLSNWGNIHYHIGEQSNLSDFKNLKLLNSIHLVVSLNVLPPELYYLSDSLKNIWLECDSQLTDLSALKQLKNVEYLMIKNFKGKSLPDLSQLKKLKTLIINANWYTRDNLKSLKGLTDCQSLQMLEIENSQIKRLDLDFSKMNLKELILSRCSLLNDISPICKAVNLKKLNLFDIPITSLPVDFDKLTSLQVLYLQDMSEMVDIRDLKQMKSLNKVLINGAFSLTEIPINFSTNKKLDSIYIEDSRQLKSAPGIAGLKNLKILSMKDVSTDLKISSNVSKDIQR